MFTARRFRLIALTALSAFAFAQAAVAAMGCATLRADAAQGNVAVMPSGEPCDMMGAAPAPLTLKHCAQDIDAATADLSPHASPFDLPTLSIRVPFADAASFVSAPAHSAPRILGPPPFRQTQRLRI